MAENKIHKEKLKRKFKYNIAKYLAKGKCSIRVTTYYYY